jgi:hypothetical protein
LAIGGDVRREALLLATFRRYTAGIDDHGEQFEVLEAHLADRDWPLLHSDNALDALSASPFAAWGLADNPTFVKAYLEIVISCRPRVCTPPSATRWPSARNHAGTAWPGARDLGDGLETADRRGL